MIWHHMFCSLTTVDVGLFPRHETKKGGRIYFVDGTGLLNRTKQKPNTFHYSFEPSGLITRIAKFLITNYFYI